jgi:hypothetical protein
MTVLHPDLITLADATQIISATSYRVLDQMRDLGEGTGDPPGDLPPPVAALANDLYDRLYIRPSEPGSPRGAGWLVHRDFLAALSAANTGRGTWDPDWTVRSIVGDGQVAVGRPELDLWAAAEHVRAATGQLAPGDKCRLRVPKELRYLMKGYYYVFGDGEEDEIEPGRSGAVEPQWRYYWHLTREAAAPFIAMATSILNAHSVPFRLKVLRDPEAYGRADAGVLYVGRRHALNLGDAIARIHEAVASGLRPEVPLLTHRLGAGLGLAEAPPASSSYGQHRCRLIARALWQSFDGGDHGRDDRLATLAATFQQNRLDPRHPYLAPGSTLESIGPAIRELPLRPEIRRDRDEAALATASNPAVGPSLCPLDAAVVIGRVLCRTAYWDDAGRLCNWMGRSPEEVTGSGAILPTALALGPELYGGSAGIALFLAQLYALTGDADCRRTAAGAIARSLRHVHDRPGSLPAPLSLFVGRLGVSYAAHRVAALTGEAELQAQAAPLLDRLDQEIDRPHRLDVIGGNAGAIPALLAMSRDSADPLERDRHRALAIALGEQLCRKAIRQGTVWSWDAEGASGPGTTTTPLTGMSHGAAGIAVALLELHAETGRSEFLKVARGAFAYEDSLFDSKVGNWPDLRDTEEPGTPPRPPSYGRAWCHGAPGIALARLRAVTLDPEHAESHLVMARAAIVTTLAAIDENLPRPGHDASLCHGLAGLLETVLHAGRLLADRVCLDAAAAVARVLIDRHGRSCDYPSGLTSGSVNPSLMLGLAGTGYAFLRLHAAEQVPSILLVGCHGP